MNLSDLSATLLAASGKDTVKVFDISKQPNDGPKQATDPCVLTYTPSPGLQVNSVKWNHTNLVIASAGEDKKISFWHKKGQKVVAVPLPASDTRDDIDEAIFSISFSNKGSRYLCSGGSGQVVRIWDLQRKRCIKWLRGHSATVTGVMYNCKDEYIASISLKGDLILHNLASGARTTDLKDPNEQILRVLDYSRTGRHVLATAGDDGSVHLWDTTGRNPKNSWTKLHSTPTTGISFSPSNDKVIASVGLDKKLHIVDSGARRPAFSTSYEAPFSSLAFKDDGSLLAAGTSNGRVVFYDVRGRPQPFTVLRAYGGSEPITSLCWQRSKPVIINESACSAENALLGGTGEDYIVMPDPLPSLTSVNLPSVTSGVSSRGSVHSGISTDTSLLTSTHISHTSSAPYLSTAEDTPLQNHLSVTGVLARLQAPHSSYNYNDDMDVFSPLVEVHPITPSLGPWWDEHDETKKENIQGDSKSKFQPPPPRKFFPTDDGNADFHPISDWKSGSSSQQDENQASLLPMNSMPIAPLKSGESYPTPPEAWGSGLPFDKFPQLRQPFSKPSRFMPSDSVGSAGLITGSQSAGSLDSLMPSHSSSSSLTATGLHMKDKSKNEVLSRFLDHSSMYDSSPLPSGIKNGAVPPSHDISVSSHLVLPIKFSTFAERISTSSFGEGAALGTGSPKLKKTGVEIKEELVNNYLSRLDATGATAGNHPSINGLNAQVQRSSDQTAEQAGSSFTLQLFQRTLDETLMSVQNSMHEDIRNLHIEVLRQFHLQETEMYSLVGSVLEKVTELAKEVQTLRKENQQLRQLL